MWKMKNQKYLEKIINTCKYIHEPLLAYFDIHIFKDILCFFGFEIIV